MPYALKYSIDFILIINFNFITFVTDYAYGHPGGFNPFMLNPGWLDAAYMNYAWTDYFRHQHQPHHPTLAAKGKYFVCILKFT